MMHVAGRNPGMPLDMDWIARTTAREGDVEACASRIRQRAPLMARDEIQLCLRAIACTDLTTLAGDDTADRVRGLCDRAKAPVDPDLLRALGRESERSDVETPTEVRTAAVCVYHRFIGDALVELEGTGIPVAAVSAGFPHGLSPLAQRIDEVRASVAEGAEEIDVVIMRAHALTGNWESLFEEVSAFRSACGDAHLKTILATGELRDLETVARASLVCMMAGSDFIKTSTGKEEVNATLTAGLVMADAIRDYRDRTGVAVGLKPAGGIRTAGQALDWLTLAGTTLGPEWTEPGLFRFGASSLLDDLVSRLRTLVAA
ncbi:MAG: deoxyribose-phosphate aldolase [marine benthic group bacterium]|nr:deoxyribose-phosphate aldolase [Gemmatimonadota bacterium]